LEEAVGVGGGLAEVLPGLEVARGQDVEVLQRRALGFEIMALAARLRRETTLTIGDIAQRLHMGSKKSLSSKLHQWRKTHEKQA
jgi:hypothetical protein